MRTADSFDVDAFGRVLPPRSADPLDVDAFGEPLTVLEATRRYEQWATIPGATYRPDIPLWPCQPRCVRSRTRAALEFAGGLMFVLAASVFVAVVVEGWLS